MFSGKEPKYYKKSKPHQEYQVYSNSETSLGSSTWEYADDVKKRKHVKFDSDYDYSLHDNYYGGRQKNVYSYPYLYESSNMYETGNEIHDYDSEDSRYTHYHQSPQQIMYTGTDSAFTTVDSDYENSGFGYRSKYRHNNSHGYKKKTNVSTKMRDIQASSFEGDLSVYFARQPTSHQTFRYKKPTRHDMSSASASEPEFQRGTVTETDEESDYPIKNKGKQPGYQVYATNVAETETNGAFKKELTTNSQEMLISVTNYDDIPLLAFKSKKTNVSPQKSISRVVYLPVLVTGMQENEEKMLTSKNINPQLFSSKNVEVAEKPVESIKVYTATNTGQKNIFERLSSKNNDNTQQNKTKDNKQQKSTVLKTEYSESNPNRVSKNINRKSGLKPVSKQSKTSYTYLPSVLRMSRAKKSNSTLNVVLPTSQPNQHNQNKIKNNRSNISVTSGKSITKAENNKDKKSSSTNRKGTEDIKILKSNSTFDDNENKKGILKTKSHTSNISGISSKSSTSASKKRRARKTNDSTKKSHSRLLIGETPTGSEKGSSFFHKAHQRELEARKTDQKSKIIQGKQETKPSTSKVSKKADESELSMSRKSKANNNVINPTTNIVSEILAQSKLTPIAQLKRSPSDVKTDESSFTMKESETKNSRQSIAKQSTIQLQGKRVSVIGTSKIINKSVLPQIPDDPHEKEADIKTKSFRKERDIIMVYEPKISDGSKKNLAKESTTVKETNVSKNKSVIKNQESNKTIEHQNIEGMKHESQPSDLNKPVQGNRKSIARESTTFRDTKTSPQKSIVQIQGNNTVIGQGKAEEKKLKNQYSDQNQTAQGRRKSLVKESMKVGETNSDQNLKVEGSRKSLIKGSMKVGETKHFSKTNSVQNQDSNAIKQDEIEEITIKSHLSDPNKIQAAEENKSILHTKSPIHEYQSKEKINENTKKSAVKEPTGAAEEIKSTGRRKSQIFQYQSIDKINEDTKKSVVKETTGSAEEIKSTDRTKSQIFQYQNKEKTNEDINNSFVKKETPDARDKGSVIGQMSPSVGERKSKVIEVPDNNREEQSGKKGGSKVSLKLPNEHKNEKNQKKITKINNHPPKDLNSEQQTAIQERPSSKLNRNSNQKSISKGAYIPVGEQKQGIKSDKTRDTDIATDKSFQRKMPEKKSSLGNNQSQPKRLSHKKKASKVKSIPKQSKINKTEYFCDFPKKLWGHNFSILITYCFKISQFILGVSTYDKFIEVLGNFH